MLDQKLKTINQVFLKKSGVLNIAKKKKNSNVSSKTPYK